MSEQELPIDTADLISKYLSGNASEQEIRQLESWVMAAPENRAQFLDLKKAWILSGLKKQQAFIDIDKEWQDVSAQLFSSGKVIKLATPKVRQRQWFGVAAAIALLIVASFLLLRQGNAVMNVEIVALNEVVQEHLPDGSKVVLNKNSTILFAKATKEKIRRVDLEGDAFFQVVRDESQPFVINTQNVQVEVLGTSFYVDSRLDQNDIRVIVQSGSVAFRQDGQEVILTAEELGLYDKNTGLLSKQVNKDANYLSWKTDALVFSNSNLEDVVLSLNRHFKANVVVESPILKSCKITATYTNKSLNAIIRILEQTLNVQSRKSEGQVILFGTGCE